MSAIQKTAALILYPSIGLLIGWGWVNVESNRVRLTAPETASAAQNSDAHLSQRPLPDRTQLLKESLLHRETMRNHHNNPVGSVISDWSDEEILAALNEALLSSDIARRSDGVALGLLSEIARRDPIRAVEWVVKLPVVEQRKYTNSLIAGWIPERLDEAFAIVKKHPDLFGKTLPWNLVIASLEDSIKKSPQAYISRLAELKKEDINSTNLNEVSGVPDGFDYAAVLDSADFKKLNLLQTKDALIQSWAIADRDAAFNWILEREGAGEAGKTGLFALKSQSHEQTPAEAYGFVSWLSEKVEGLTPEQRAKFMEVHHHRIKPDGLMWIAAAKNPEWKQEVISKASEQVFSPMYSGVETGFSSLEALPDVESRLEALEKQLRNAPSSRYVGKRSDPVRQLMHSYLIKWGVDSQRAESLVKRMHDDIPVINLGK